MNKSTFSEKVYAITRKISKGKVSTYKQTAILAGNQKACRAVGNILNKNIDKTVPCHRVVRTDGYIGGFNRGIEEKIRILKSEGIEIKKGKINKKYFWEL